MEELTRIPLRSETALHQKRKGGHVAAVFPIHYPRALLRAFNIQPIEVWGPPQVKSSAGTTHVQPYICSIVRNALSFIHAGGLEVTDLFLVPHACDSLQGLGSVLLDFVQPRQSVLPLYLPRNRNQEGLEFLADEFRDLYRRLHKITGLSPRDAQLSDCIRREEEADHMLRKLHENRTRLPMADYELYHIIRAREFLPAEEFISLAQRTCDQSSDSKTAGIPVVISGIVPEPMEVFQAINASGGSVVADDLASCGRRLYPQSTHDNPFLRMAERILNGPPDSTRGDPVEERFENLSKIAERNQARGILFYNVKFCEPELFYYPALRERLAEEGFPSILLEIDLSESLSQQNQTKIEAFLEMLS
jgi:benzoyl-CoA reductase/2-hydroxyglutaryl-CoA dehydratase subunit BcrC/BadD/HgdB